MAMQPAPRTSSRPPYAAPGKDGGVWRLDVWVQPGAAKSGPAGLYQDRLKVRVAAPANDNKANDELVAFMARALGLKRSQVELAAGRTGRGKTLLIHSSEEPAWARLAPADEV